jgi:DNA-binding Lrp family transcriptional regulator
VKVAATIDSVSLEHDDVRILRALQIDPRIGFAALAAALGSSEPTVARRYRRMVRQGVLRVTGVVDPGAHGQSQWMVRLRCRPGSGSPLADGLARRDDVSWVALSGAGSEVTCVVRSRSAEQRDDLFGHKLPRAASVLDLQAAVVLRKFLGGRGRYWAALNGALTLAEEAALGSGDGRPAELPIVNPEPVELSAEDEKLLAALAADGRASLVDLAATAGLTPGRASRRLQALLAGRLTYLHVEIAPAALGFHTRSNLWLRVHPAKLKTVGSALAQMAEVGSVVALSGPHYLQATVHCRDLDELFDFTSDRVGTLPGVESMEVSPISRQVKQAGTLVSGGRLIDRP